MASKDTIGKTLTVSLLLCVVCSLIVSAAAVLLRPAQLENKSLDKKRNILLAAGLYEEGKSVDEQFKQVNTRLVDLRTGEFSEDYDPENFDQRKASKDPSTSTSLSDAEDIAKIGRRSNYGVIYTIGDSENPDKIILPIHGYGLWSTLYGFIALEKDANTIAGLGFYDHGETPGLGGEVDNPRWKKIWLGKKVYDENGVAIEVVKGSVDPQASGVQYKVDGLSGATLTSRGVSLLVQYWMGEGGYQPFLKNLRNNEA